MDQPTVLARTSHHGHGLRGAGGTMIHVMPYLRAVG